MSTKLGAIHLLWLLNTVLRYQGEMTQLLMYKINKCSCFRGQVAPIGIKCKQVQWGCRLLKLNLDESPIVDIGLAGLFRENGKTDTCDRRSPCHFSAVYPIMPFNCNCLKPTFCTDERLLIIQRGAGQLLSDYSRLLAELAEFAERLCGYLPVATYTY